MLLSPNITATSATSGSLNNTGSRDPASKSNETEESGEDSDISNIATRVSLDHPHHFIHRLETIAKHLSHVTTRDTLTISPDDFNLASILRNFLKNADIQNVHLRSTGVMLENVCTLGIDRSATFAKTVGSRFNIPGKVMEKIKNRGNRKPTKRILNNINGIVKAGEMCLLLGRPGAGCSTLLKNIAGEGMDQYFSTIGEISFDGISLNEMLKTHKNDFIYNPELDVHFPHLTVHQTLKFAVGCKVPQVRVAVVPGEISTDQYVNFKVDMIATLFGLRHAYDTKVGNDFVHGISGGERKRVSIAEALAADGKVYCWDNATRGLDSSTALEYATAIRVLTNVMHSTNFVTIYQASENIYEKFDKVMVLYEGRQIYFGSTKHAKPFFEKMGFECPKRQTTAEFLTAITDRNGRYPRPGFENRVPRSAAEFEAYWLKSPEFSSLKDEIKLYKESIDAKHTRNLFYESSKQEKSKVNSSYTVSYFQQLKLNLIRSYQIVIGDFTYLATQITSDIIQALIIGSLFYQITDSTTGAFSRGGVLFFAVLYYSLAGMALTSNSFAKRPILLKQRGYSFCHPSTEFFSSFIVDQAFKLIGITGFCIIVFFLSGLKRAPGNFFVFYLFTILTSATMNSLFQFVALMSPNISVANPFAGLIILSAVQYSSYMIQLPSMQPWFKWISYINPVRYGFESMLVDEFHNVNMPCTVSLVPQGPYYNDLPITYKTCAFSGSQPGENYVSGNNYLRVAYQYYFSHLWKNFGILVGFLIFFLSIAGIASEFIRTDKVGYDVLIFKKTKETRQIIQELRIAAHRNEVDYEKQSEGSSPMVDNLEENPNVNNIIKSTKVFEGLGSEDVFMWRNVNYEVKLRDGTFRKLLHDIQGYIKPGTLTALMGESGAGKTTLLNILSQRVDVGIVTGDISVNGGVLASSFQRRTGYVQQQDVHFSELTVRESLRFSARLRRSREVSDQAKCEYVEEIIKILGMVAYSDAIVGKTGYGLNVEQRKKLSIGVELVAKPSLLLFLDEPTSGLDSQSSFAIVKLLKDLAHAGQAILCTIHQPSAVLFEQFDRLLLLKKGGYTVYFGDIGEHSRIMLDYFEAHGGRKCEEFENPAEYILETIGAGATATVTQDWGNNWLDSQEYQVLLKSMTNLFSTTSTARTGDAIITSQDKKLKKFETPYYYQLALVIHRVARQFWRDPVYITGKFFLSVMAGLYIGFTFWDADNGIIGMRNELFSVFMSIIISVPLIQQTQSRALQSREVFEIRESKSNTYHWLALLLAQYINELPYHLVLSTLFFVAMYFPVHRNYNSYTVGVYYMFYCIIFQLYYLSFGLWILYMSPDLPSATVLISLCLAFMIAFSGVIQPESQMPGFWTFMWKISPFTYFIQIFMSLSLHGIDVRCRESEYAIINPPSSKTCGQYLDPFINTRGGYVKNPNATGSCQYCAYSSGDQYLKTISISYSTLWRNFGFFWVYICFNLIAMVSMYYLLRVKRIKLIPISHIKRLSGKIKPKKK
ncbi:hypothetical protein DASC09_008420 [Saccharomycopsis crataegensis]|uniref:ABC transporter domain-containing protein n=1 Tax=Saccharomycopsis crataegensis TaxID=43959 RepID=A0AAV5QFT4_9ASCO|nr:hypothetical protein DASC09_008420 [Saccharomycopsis crataegensis]